MSEWTYEVNVNNDIWRGDLVNSREKAIRRGMEEGLNIDDDRKAIYEAGLIENYGIDEEIEKFADLWDSTVNKKDLEKYGWDTNPYVWVIEFERISKDEALKESN